MSNNNISVVCPVYNSGLYIEDTLQSLLLQEFQPFEIIFSDDGSTDDTIEKIKQRIPEFTAKGVKTRILSNPHQGPGENRNVAIKFSTGDWIAFIDSDDIWLSAKLKNVQKIITADDGTNFIIHWEEYNKITGDKITLKHGSKYDVSKNLKKQIFIANNFSTSAVVCKKDLIEKVGFFDKDLQVSQDYELWLRMSPYIHLAVIETVLGKYIEIDSSISARPYHKRYPYLIRILFRHWKKAGFKILIYRLIRATISKQWSTSFRQIIGGQRRH